MQGLSTEWRGPSGLQVVAGGGTPGLYDGIVVPNFRTLDGSTATAGVQWSPASHWTAGAQLIEAHDVNLAIGPVIDGPALMSSTAGLVSAAWADQSAHVQMNLLDGAAGGDLNGRGNALGAWVDGSIAQGRFLQNAGVFRIDPNLTWGNQLISNDAQGGYYRLNYQSRQWLADAGIDEVRSVSGLGTNTTFLTGDARYQLSRDWGVGGVVNASHSSGGGVNASHSSGGDSWSLQGYVDRSNGGGTRPRAGRLRADSAGPGRGPYAEPDLVAAAGASSQHIDLGGTHQWRASSTAWHKTARCSAWPPMAADNSPRAWGWRAMYVGPPPCRAGPLPAYPPMCR